MKSILSILTLLICFLVSSQSLEVTQTTFKSETGKIVNAEEGVLYVPENRQNPTSEKIPIKFIKLKSTNTQPQHPIFYLEGGPGSSCSWQAENPEYLENWIPYLAIGDVILLDQRGTGANAQRTMYIWQNDLPQNLFVNAGTYKAHHDNIAEAAIINYKQKGVDIEGYTTMENANDIEDLRSALGYEKITLYGFSYGTHLGQTYMKYYPKKVNKAILVGVEGLNETIKLPLSMDLQFKKITAMAKADPNINKDISNLEDLYRKVIHQLSERPVELTINSALTRQPIQVKVGPFGLNTVLRMDIGDASDIPVFPKLLYTIYKEDYSLLKWFVQKRHQMVYGVLGMSVIMDAASGATKSRLNLIKDQEEISLFKNVVNFPSSKKWSIPDLGDDFRRSFSSDIPTLLMSGTLDFNTPPYQAEKLRWGLSNSTHIIVQNAGHEQITRHPKATSTIIKFLLGENVDTITMSYPKLKFIPVTGSSKDLWHPSMNNENN